MFGTPEVVDEEVYLAKCSPFKSKLNTADLVSKGEACTSAVASSVASSARRMTRKER